MRPNRKTGRDNDLEYIDLENGMPDGNDGECDLLDGDDEEYDLPDEDYVEAYDDAFDEELDENTLRFVKRVLFPAVIVIVAVVTAVAVFFLFRGGMEEETLPAIEEISQIQDTAQETDADVSAG